MPDQALVETLCILGVVGPCLHAALEPNLAALLPGLAASCAHADARMQAAAAGCTQSLVGARAAACAAQPAAVCSCCQGSSSVKP